MYRNFDDCRQGGFRMIVMLIFIVAVCWLVIEVVKYFKNKNNIQSSDLEVKETALEILNRRYANGEISTKEYNERKKVISSE